MKEVIKKAIENGFDITKQLFPHAMGAVNILSWYWLKYETSASSNGELKITSQQSDILHNCVDYFSTYGLIFGTNFIECLVGKDVVCNNCGEDPTKNQWHRSPVKPNGEYYNCCQGHRFIPKADYHRAQMANIKDIEKLKEYARKLT